MKRRHGGHMGGGGMNTNRRPQGRFHNNGGGYQRQGGGAPRKNYAALREKYMNQARDAMSSGDRVLAEYYLQHADHCYRMQQEFLAERNARFQQQQQDASAMPEEPAEETNGVEDAEQDIANANTGNVLPAFLTRPAVAAASGNADAPPAPRNWEEE